MAEFWLDIPNPFWQLLTWCALVCRNSKFYTGFANTNWCCGHRVAYSCWVCVSGLDQHNSHTIAESLTKPSGHTLHMCLMFAAQPPLWFWCYLRGTDLRGSFVGDTWPLSSARLDSESCCSVTCRGVVSFRASPPTDRQQVSRRPLDSVCVRRAKCPPAAWQRARGSASETSPDIWKEPLTVLLQLSFMHMVAPLWTRCLTPHATSNHVDLTSSTHHI